MKSLLDEISGSQPSSLMAATAQSLPEQAHALGRARAFAFMECWIATLKSAKDATAAEPTTTSSNSCRWMACAFCFWPCHAQCSAD